MGLPLCLLAAPHWLGPLLLSDIERSFTVCGTEHRGFLHFAQMLHCMYSKPLNIIIWLGLLTMFQARMEKGAHRTNKF